MGLLFGKISLVYSWFGEGYQGYSAPGFSTSSRVFLTRKAKF